MAERVLLVAIQVLVQLTFLDTIVYKVLYACHDPNIPSDTPKPD